MNITSALALYRFLTRFRILKRSYTLKIMVVAFLGTHVPLLTLVASFLVSNDYPWEVTLRILGIALVATLVGTAGTLLALKQLLKPVDLTSLALRTYLSTGALPNLPTQFSDTVGTLMADTAQTLRKLDELIHHISNYDALTGLPNRDLFGNRLFQVVQSPSRPGQSVALLLVGIDEFDSIHHGQDRETVDRLVREVAQRLSTCVSRPELLARLGNDEFVFVEDDIISFEQVIQLAQRFISDLGKPFHINGAIIHLTASVGIVIDTIAERADCDRLLQKAHIALHQTQVEQRNSYQFYSPETNVYLQEQLTLENALYGALDRHEIQVYYQPLIDLKRQEIVAVEALVRWDHPSLGMISPGRFIPIAEANGLILPIGEWVLRTACAQNRAWQEADLAPIRMSVNLSARQFEQPHLVETVRQILEDTHLDASLLELEVTESFLMCDVENSVKTLHQLRELGVWLALDDFGTGYSSLSHLKRFPVDMLKIDRSFVQDVTTNRDSAAVTNAIVALANSLNLRITAEGVETQEQLDYLSAKGCDEAQGFYLGRPMPAQVVQQRLERMTLFEQATSIN